MQERNAPDLMPLLIGVLIRGLSKMTENISYERTPTKVLNRRSDENLLPTPFVTAGIGLLLGVTFPGGMSGGKGFIIGLFIGIGLSILVPVFTARTRHTVTHCPKCGATIDPSPETDQSQPLSMGDKQDER